MDPLVGGEVLVTAFGHRQHFYTVEGALYLLLRVATAPVSTNSTFGVSDRAKRRAPMGFSRVIEQSEHEYNDVASEFIEKPENRRASPEDDPGTKVPDYAESDCHF